MRDEREEKERESYLALSSLTHLRGPVAVTVAALGRSSIKAISPK